MYIAETYSFGISNTEKSNLQVLQLTGQIHIDIKRYNALRFWFLRFSIYVKKNGVIYSWRRKMKKYGCQRAIMVITKKPWHLGERQKDALTSWNYNKNYHMATISNHETKILSS